MGEEPNSQTTAPRTSQKYIVAKPSSWCPMSARTATKRRNPQQRSLTS